MELSLIMCNLDAQLIYGAKLFHNKIKFHLKIEQNIQFQSAPLPPKLDYLFLVFTIFFIRLIFFLVT